MADAGPRKGEALHLLVQNWQAHERALFVRSGKGANDRTVFVCAGTARAIKAWLALPCTRNHRLRHGCSVSATYESGVVTILHRLSIRGVLPLDRRLHPHNFRHLAATAWLRNGMGLDQVRRLLGHSGLNTTLRYSSLVSADLQQAPGGGGDRPDGLG